MNALQHTSFCFGDGSAHCRPFLCAEGLLAYKSTRRHWVKLWVGEWLDGTTRFELKPEQRLLWVDLLALAGRSRFPGMIYPGLSQENKKIGYPLSYLAGVLSFQPDGLRPALEILRRHGHIEIEEPSEDCLVISIVNWDKYQSEYQRQKASRKPLNGNVRAETRQSAQEVTPKNTPMLLVEGEVEVEVEVEEEKRQRTAAAFATMNCEPYGTAKFQSLWAEEQQSNGSHSFADAMERCIQRCASLKVKVPGRFFAHKREIEKLEAANNYKGTPP